LNYAQPPFVIQPDDTNDALGSLTAVASLLGAGSGSIAINFLAASINDGFQNALNILQAHSMAGSFWVPTGGGSTSVFPPAPPTPVQGATGLDKDGRLVAQRTAALTAKLNTPLDEPFPFEAIAFNTALL